MRSYSIPPDGYKKLPPDMACRGCAATWQEADGSYWCCGNSKTLAALLEIIKHDQIGGWAPEGTVRNGDPVTGTYDGECAKIARAVF